MTYCVGLMLDQGLIFAADSRRCEGADNLASFCKLTTFERAGDRVIVLLGSGNLASTQAVCSLLRWRSARDAATGLWAARSILEVVVLASDAIRDADLRYMPQLGGGSAGFNASFILGGQIRGEAPHLFRIHADGSFVEAGAEAPYLQNGETTYGNPIIEWVIRHRTPLNEAAKCVLASFDTTMRSNLSVAMPIDLICYRRDSLVIDMRRRFEASDAYFANLSAKWSEGTRSVIRSLPELSWP